MELVHNLSVLKETGFFGEGVKHFGGGFIERTFADLVAIADCDGHWYSIFSQKINSQNFLLIRILFFLYQLSTNHFPSFLFYSRNSFIP